MTVESEPIDAVQQFNQSSMEDLCLNNNDDSELVELDDEIECMRKMGLPVAFESKKGGAKKKSKRKEPQGGATKKPAKKRKTDVVSAKSVERFRDRKLLLFSKWLEFGDDIVIDDEMYYSITPEETATKIALHCKNKTNYTILLDGFCGLGGNLIQFAVQNENAFIVGIDSSFERVQSASKIARIYGVEHRCDFICGDFFRMAPSLMIKPDVVFLSPPWGAWKYKLKKTFLLKDLPVDGNKIFELSKQLTNNIAFYLPKNQDLGDLDRLNETYTVEKNETDRFGLTLTMYFGDLIDPDKVRPATQFLPPDFHHLPPAIGLAEEPVSTGSVLFSAPSISKGRKNNLNLGETSRSALIDTSLKDSEAKDGTSGQPDDLVQTTNRSSMRLRSQTKKDAPKADSKNIFKRAKKMVIAEVLKEKKCCLM